MSLPLYKPLHDNPPKRVGDGHAGLWFDKFCNTWRVQGDSWTMTSRDSPNPKTEWIKTLAGQSVGKDGQITEFAHRMVGLIEGQGGEWAIFESESRFVTGLGRSHPVENGFAWHPTLGTPYIPGSSVKGMTRAWARGEGEDCKTLNRLLGGPDDAGVVCFLDAIPVTSVQLEADVMTPHYAGWNENDPPGDWKSPTPIPFLVSAAETAFLFGVIPVRRADKDDAKRVMRWLSDALEWAGAGAKTAVGYGRFAQDESAADRLRNRIKEAQQQSEQARAELEAERERQAELATRSPVEQEIQEVLDSRSDPGMPDTTVVFNAIEAGRWSGDEKIEAAQWLKAQMEEERTWRPETGVRIPVQHRKNNQRTLAIIAWLEEA